MEWHGRKAHTCGETGGVAFTDPELSGKAAQMRMEQAARTGAEILVSADPECEEILARTGGREVKKPGRVGRRNGLGHCPSLLVGITE